MRSKELETRTVFMEDRGSSKAFNFSFSLFPLCVCVCVCVCVCKMCTRMHVSEYMGVYGCMHAPVETREQSHVLSSGNPSVSLKTVSLIGLLWLGV